MRIFIVHKFSAFIHNSKLFIHMRQATKNFDFQFPLTHKIVRNLKIVNEHIGDLQVEGSASVKISRAIDGAGSSGMAQRLRNVVWVPTVLECFHIAWPPGNADPHGPPPDPT